MLFDHPSTMHATAAAIRDGRMTAVEVARAALDRHGQHGDLGALAWVDVDDVLRQAQALDRLMAAGGAVGPLHGVPLVIKDNIHVGGLPNSAGTPALAGFMPTDDAGAVTRLRAAGAVILGKARMHELAMGWTGQSAHADDTRNPHGPDRMAGGSSGGTAAAIAAGIVPGGLGTDTNGSIRIPAAFCGVAGLRPTYGSLPVDGVTPLAPSLDTVGPMAEDVAGLALLFAVLSDDAIPDLHHLGGLRFGIVPSYFETVLSGDTRAVFALARQRLLSAGVQLVELDLPVLQHLVPGSAPATIAHESHAALAGYLTQIDAGITMETLVAGADEDLHRALRVSDPNMLAAYRAAQERRTMLAAVLAATFSHHGLDALLYPTTPMVAPPLQSGRLVSPAPDVSVDGDVTPARIAFARNISPASLAGLPSLTIPARNPGLPVGLQLDGPRGGDARLLAIGRLVETAIAV